MSRNINITREINNLKESLLKRTTGHTNVRAHWKVTVVLAVEGTKLKHRREVQNISNKLNELDVSNVAIIDKVKNNRIYQFTSTLEGTSGVCG